MTQCPTEQVRYLCLGKPTRQEERHELQLGSVVKISLQAMALGVGSLEQARPRLPHLREIIFRDELGALHVRLAPNSRPGITRFTVA